MGQALIEALLAHRELDLRDEDGRWLSEPPSPDEEIPCPYLDRRRGRPMNQAALAQVRRHWPFVTRTVRALAGSTLRQAFRASLAAVTAPIAVTHPPVPAPWSALYKACVGFSQVFTFLLLEEDDLGELPLAELGPLLPWLERESWLLGERQVCAGSSAMLEELHQAFCNGQPGPVEIPLEHLDLAIASVALQAALVIATYRCPSERGEALGVCLLERSRAPWMHAVTAIPGRDPADALRLSSATSVREFVRRESASMSHAQREQLFWEVQA